MTDEERRASKRARDRAYYHKHAIVKRARQRDYHKRNKTEIAVKAKAYSVANCEKLREYHKQYRETNRIALREKELIRRYGVDYAEYKRLVVLQNGKCAICGAKRKLVIDHKHNGTRNVRGLLCTHCNVGLGMLREDIAILFAAIEYIRH